MSQQDRESGTPLEARARELFAVQVAGLDAGTRSRLARARAAAVEAAASDRGWLLAAPARWLPAGAVVAAVLAVVLLWQDPAATLDPVEATVLGDLDVLLEGEELDLFEDLEFYAWLLGQPELLESADGGDDNG